MCVCVWFCSGEGVENDHRPCTVQPCSLPGPQGIALRPPYQLTRAVNNNNKLTPSAGGSPGDCVTLLHVPLIYKVNLTPPLASRTDGGRLHNTPLQSIITPTLPSGPQTHTPLGLRAAKGHVYTFDWSRCYVTIPPHRSRRCDGCDEEYCQGITLCWRLGSCPLSARRGGVFITGYSLTPFAVFPDAVCRISLGTARVRTVCHSRNDHVLSSYGNGYTSYRRH